MPALVSTPVMAYSTTAAWIAAPAIGADDIAWLEVDGSDGDASVVAGFRGDRLILRTGRRNTRIVDQPCTELPCRTVQGPVAAGDGSFAYAVAFPGTGGYVAGVAAGGISTVIAEDATDPREIRAPHPVAAAGTTAVWVDEDAILAAPTAGGSAATLVAAARTGGTVTSVAASVAGVAWTAGQATGGTVVGFRTAAGGISTRAAEADPAAAVLLAVAVADDGTVVATRRTFVKRRPVIQLVAYAADGTTPVLLTSVPVPRRDLDAPRPAVAGTRVAVRLRGGRRGTRDQLWVVDLVTRKRSRVASIDRVSGRLTDPALGAGRIVWARDDIEGTRLVRARVYTAVVRP